MATPLDSVDPLSGLQLMVGWRRVAYESESIGVVVGGGGGSYGSNSR